MALSRAQRPSLNSNEWYSGGGVGFNPRKHETAELQLYHMTSSVSSHTLVSQSPPCTWGSLKPLALAMCLDPVQPLPSQELDLLLPYPHSSSCPLYLPQAAPWWLVGLYWLGSQLLWPARLLCGLRVTPDLKLA